MPEPHALSPLLRWESFYVIVGSSAAVLTGLQFVVIAVVGETRPRSSDAEIGAFATPTIVHFGAVLWIAAALSAPWDRLSPVAIVLGLTGAAGVGYTGLVSRRARRQAGYVPVLEDWIWHAVLPFAAYGMVLGAALALGRHAAIGALFTVAAASLLLLFVGLHNAWDAVTYMTLEALKAKTDEPPRREPPPA